MEVTPAARKLFGNLDNRPCVTLTAFVQRTGVSIRVMEKKGEGPIKAGLEKENLISSALIRMLLSGNCSRQTQLSRDGGQGLDFSIVFSTGSPQEDPGSEARFIHKSSPPDSYLGWVVWFHVFLRAGKRFPGHLLHQGLATFLGQPGDV